MMNLKNLTQYIPAENALVEGVLFLKDDQGSDWYESQKNFAADTLKIAYNSEGVICSAYTDVSKLWPVNMSVAEINATDLPDGFAVDGNWVYDGKTVEARTYSQAELTAKASVRREQLMAQAATVIAPLQDAVDLDEATVEDAASLKAWKTYRVMLNRVDTSKAPNVTWPVVPA